MMTFASREAAGRELGQQLQVSKIPVDLVLGLPRGGVVVAAEVAREMSCPLDAMVVRKLGHPRQREFAVGALAEPDIVIFDEGAIRPGGTLQEQFEAIVAEEQHRLRDYRSRFHLRPAPDLNGRSVLIVDDGLATGLTAEAAVQAARKRGAKNIFVAAPVASGSAVKRLLRTADAVHTLLTDPDFEAVGAYYKDFDQTTDETVIALLQAGGD